MTWAAQCYAVINIVNIILIRPDRDNMMWLEKTIFHAALFANEIITCKNCFTPFLPFNFTPKPPVL